MWKFDQAPQNRAPGTLIHMRYDSNLAVSLRFESHFFRMLRHIHTDCSKF